RRSLERPAARGPAGPAEGQEGGIRRPGGVYSRNGVSLGLFFPSAMIAAYGVANLLQSAAAARTTVHHTFDPSLLLRLASQRTYLIGLGCQVLGFVFAFLARRDLPLFLVQASVAAG